MTDPAPSSAPAPYPSLADFAATWNDQSEASSVAYAFQPPPAVLSVLADYQLKQHAEEVIETLVEMRRAQWLQDGVYIGPQVLPDLYRQVLACARTLHIGVPPTIASGCSYNEQGVYGTDNRSFMYVSTFFTTASDDDELRFFLGRQCGHIHAQHVTWLSLYALTVQEHGLRPLATRLLGPAAGLLLTPLSLATRVALSRWHRAADITADRAGMLCAGSLHAAQRCILRMIMKTRQADVTVDAYLEQLKNARTETSPGRWAELLSSHPWTHRRVRALELFSRSQLWAELRGEDPAEDALSTPELDARTHSLLKVNG